MRNIYIFYCFTLTFILFSKEGFSDNPIIKTKFTADPCAMVYGNTVYLYTGHDEASTTASDYVMNNWHVFSSQDMVNWTDHGQKLAVSNFTWARSSAFAGHTVHRNGKFYWYVPMIQSSGGYFSIGVAVADSPLGPFTDAIGKPLIADEMTTDLLYDIDPAVFIDDDGQAYIYWGNATQGGPCKMAKLKSNMTEIDGVITTVNIPNFTEAPYMHKRKGTYYLSYASGWPETIAYCTSTSPNGPWISKGTLNGRVSSSTNHQSIIEFKGKSYFVYHNANLPTGGDYRRSVCVDYLNYNTDGTMQAIVQTTQGVAAANATPEVAPWQSTEKITGAHDPTVIRDDRGVYTMLTTNNLCELRQSSDMMNWTSAGRIFSGVPAWINTSLNTTVADLWAPQITFRNGRYWVYYCGSSFGTNNSAIGVASSPTLNTSAANYSWTDHGEVFKSSTSNNYNAIDPELLVDLNGNLWLSFGSFWTGIKMIAIDPTTGKRLASNSTIYSIASRGGGAIEGPSTMEHNGYYFLFTSWDKCCSGITSTYRTMVGRSTSPTGGYVDKQNNSLTNNFSQELLKTYGRYIGPGGGSPFKDGRRDYYALHYYNGNANGNPTLQIREIVWDDSNWPILSQPFLGRRLSYEAEHAILTGAAISTSTNASNKEYIGNINTATSKVLFYVNAFAAGEYTIRIHYSAVSNASHFLKVNNGTSTEVFYPLTGTAGQFPSGQAVSVKVILKEGGNTLELMKGTNVAELDRIDLIRNTFAKLEGGAKDNGVGVTYISTGNNSTMTVNSWQMFENFDFANGGLKNLNIALANFSSAQFRVSIDTQTGSTNGTFITSAILNSFVLPASLQAVTGVHDVFITLVSGTCELDYLQFDNKDPNSATTCSASISSGGPNTFCQGGSVILTASAGSSFIWKNGNTQVGTAQTYTATTAGSYTVQVTNATGCISTSVITTVSVNTPPAAPAVSTPVVYCQNATATSLIATGTALKWYTVSTGGTSSATAPTPATNTARTSNYYVSQTTNNCESARAIIAVTINASPLAPTISSPVTYCQNTPANVLNASGTALKWYTASTGGTSSATAPTPVTSVIGTINYYVSQTINNCESARATIAVTINALPSSPTISSPLTYCQNATAAALTASGTALKWYIVSTGGISSATSPTPVTTSIGTTNYYVSQTINNCESPRSRIAITVSSPTAVLPYLQMDGGTWLQQNSAQICAGGSVVVGPQPVSTTGWSWTGPNNFSANTREITLSNLVSSQGGVYIATYKDANGCSSTSNVTLIVNALPSAPIVSTPLTYCQNATAAALTATGTALKWYPVSTGGTGSSAAPTPVTSTIGTFNYYVSQTMNNCESARALLAVAINSASAIVTPGGPVAFCQGESVTLTANTGTFYKWFNGAVQVGNSASYTATTAGNYTVEVTNASSCKAISSATIVTVNALPLAVITASGPLTLPQGGSVTLISSVGSSYQWFNGINQIGTNSTYIATASGNYSVEVTNATGCKNTSSSVTLTMNSNQFPLVNIIAPLNGKMYVETATVIIEASASDADGTISLVEFYNGTVLLGNDATLPYSFTWSPVMAGTYNISAKAIDNSGEAGTSAPVSITVNGNQPSVITITSPINYSSIAGTSVTINVSATDPDGSISIVEYYDGTTKIGSSTNQPYSYTWNNVTAGTHEISVRVTDSNGGVTTSLPTTVLVPAQTGILSFSVIDVFSKVYPNPASTLIHIETIINLETASIKFLDALGSEVSITLTVSGMTASADLSLLSPGVYLLLITQDDFIIRKKVIVVD